MSPILDGDLSLFAFSLGKSHSTDGKSIELLSVMKNTTSKAHHPQGNTAAGQPIMKLVADEAPAPKAKPTTPQPPELRDGQTLWRITCLSSYQREKSNAKGIESRYALSWVVVISIGKKHGRAVRVGNNPGEVLKHSIKRFAEKVDDTNIYGHREGFGELWFSTPLEAWKSELIYAKDTSAEADSKASDAALEAKEKRKDVQAIEKQIKSMTFNALNASKPQKPKASTWYEKTMKENSTASKK
jgi:hypothetical protein